MEHGSNGDTNCNLCTWNNPQMIGKETGRSGNKRTRGDHPDYSIIKIGQKSPGDLRRLVAKQTLVSIHRLTCEKFSKEQNNNNNNNNNKPLS